LLEGPVSVYEPAVILHWVPEALAVTSVVLLAWQWLVALRFPLHEREAEPAFVPGVTLLKPLKGADETTEESLRSWFTQDYSGEMQILFGLASADDPAAEVVKKLLREFPNTDAELRVCGPITGANAKVSKLAELERLAKHELLLISDADVRVPEDFLSNAIVPMSEEGTGLVNCFYTLANPSTPAMRWEAIAINADFWSQVLQSQSIKPLDFALGAVMLTRRDLLAEIGGFESLKNCLADDYQLGHSIARNGHQIRLCKVVVECWSAPMSWGEVWKHQLRWARTIRVCQPLAYFFSVLSNPTFWPLLWVLTKPTRAVWVSCGCFWLFRAFCASQLQSRLTARKVPVLNVMMVWLKDLLQLALWFCAFAGNTVEWRGQRMRLRRDGSIEELSRPGR